MSRTIMNQDTARSIDTIARTCIAVRLRPVGRVCVEVPDGRVIGQVHGHRLFLYMQRSSKKKRTH